jgi:HK97 family phage major capsid protein
VIKGAVPGAGVETIKQNKKGEEKMTNEVEVAKADATQTEDTATKTNEEVIDEVIGAVQTAVEGVATELKAPKEDKPTEDTTEDTGAMAKFRKQIEEDIMNKMNSEIRKNVKIENNVTKSDEATATFTKYLRGEQADFTKLDRTKTGALIPEIKSKEILKEIKNGSVFFGASTVVSGTSNEYKFVVRKDDRANNVEGVAEGAGNTLNGELEFTQISFGAETLQGKFPVTDEALADSGYNLLDEITGATAEDFAEKLGQLITKGQKSSTNAIAGFLNDPSTISQVTANVGTFNQNDLIKLTRNKGMKSKYRKNAKLYVSPSAYTEMERWVDANGRPLLTPTLTADNNIVSKFKGYEIVEEEYLEDVKTGKFPVFFGDFKSFYGMFVRINTFETEKERRANERINIFYTRCRMGGGVIRPKAGVVLQVK